MDGIEARPSEDRTRGYNRPQQRPHSHVAASELRHHRAIHVIPIPMCGRRARLGRLERRADICRNTEASGGPASYVLREFARSLYVFTLLPSLAQDIQILTWIRSTGIGDQPFDDRNSPRDHVITALVTLGEGYHNFHHEFPSDYRNAIQWHQYDPTKWAIYFWKQLGLASNLKTFPGNEIEKGRVQQLQKKIDRNRATLDWGVPLDELPLVEWDDFVARAKEGEALVAIGGIIHDVGGFVKDHPGGKALINSAIGKDATAMFNGGVYNHLNAAHNLLSTMRIGVLRGGLEVEVWKRSQILTKNV